MNIASLSTVQLNKIVKLKSQIERLESQLAQLAGSQDSSPGLIRKRKPMSAAAKAKIAAAQKARWAKAKGTTSKAAKAPVKKAKRKISAEGLARIKAAQKARWAKVKAQK